MRTLEHLATIALTASLVACSSEDARSKDGGGDAGKVPQGLACRPAQRVEPPACGTATGSWTSLAPPDAQVDAAATRHDRQFHALNAHGTGVNADLNVPLDRTAARDAIGAFVADETAWDFEAHSGMKVTDAVGSFAKVAGLYAGVGIAADAYRYLSLLHGGAACEEIDRARGHLARDLDALHLAVAVTGTPGVIARGFALKSLGGDGMFETTPLFDADGNALPPVKDNGTWREDVSGRYPDVIWEDSCSRDMLVGWALAFAAAWEAIRLDPAFDDAQRARLQSDAEALARSLMLVGEEGYDLEIRDADGRRTYHGILNENSLDRLYLPNAKNGFNAMMSLGIVGAFAYVAEEPELDAWLADTLVGERRLHELARDELGLVDLGLQSNYSSYNMAFTGGFAATRYLCDEVPRRAVRDGISKGLYDREGRDRQPAEQKMTFYDFVHAAATAGGTAWSAPDGAVDEAAVERGMETLREFPVAPFWARARDNCDDAEIASGSCVATDGTPLEVLGTVGRNDALVAAAPVPMRIRPHSNYYWRSNPYEVNGSGDGSGLLPAVDFRIAYWMGRWVRR